MMQTVLTKEQTILPSGCGRDAKMRMSSLMDVFMDAAMEHAEILGVGISDYRPKNLFWVASKNKIRFYRTPRMTERVNVSTWPEAPGNLKCIRDYEMKAGDEILAVGKTEWVVIETVGKKPQSTKDVYPADFEFCDKIAIVEPFERIGKLEGEIFGEYTVRSVDIDYGGHMNNVAYIRALEGLFSCDELDGYGFIDLEIHYRQSCFEGDTIKFFKKEENGRIYFKVTASDDAVIAYAILTKGGVEANK